MMRTSATVLHRHGRAIPRQSHVRRVSVRPLSSLLSCLAASPPLPPARSSSLSARLLSTAPSSSSISYTNNDFTLSTRKGIRNVAVIAHVDHGKTTLVDRLLALTKHGQDSTPTERLLDSNELEKERGITITSKVTRLELDDIVINCVDTPGHADFSAEVDRVLSLVDGVVLVVDAGEGPKSQTKYVLTRALALGLKPLVVLNKCDRAESVSNIDSGETESRLEALFGALGANEEQLAYKTLYASARAGWITDDPLVALEMAEGGGDAVSEVKDMRMLLDAIVEQIPEPSIRCYNENGTVDEDPFSLAAVSVGYDQYLGRTATGRIVSGCIRENDKVTLIKRDAQAFTESAETTNVSGVFVYQGISRIPLDGVASAGDIVTLTGVPNSMAVGDSLTSTSNPVAYPIETPPLAPPTLAMDFGANNGPLAGSEGSKIATSQIYDRLIAETDNNVTLKVQKSETDVEKTTVYARGELQLGILVEKLRREGFEMVISPPRILTTTCPETGKEMEPFEEVTVDVDAEYASTVVSSLTGDRKGVLLESLVSSDDKTRLVFEVPTRGLLGFQSEIATATKGSAVVNHLYLEHREHAGSLGTGLDKGKLVSNAAGKATSYALTTLAQRGVLFVEPSDLVYAGMVIGENAKPGDMEVNPVRAKEKTNIRTVAKDEKVTLAPPKRRSVEELIGYLQSDELIEVTPKSIRLRKELLDSSERERAARVKAKQLRSQREAAAK